MADSNLLKMTRRLLIVGNATSHHVVGFIKTFSNKYPNIIVDIYNTNAGGVEVIHDIDGVYDRVLTPTRHNPCWLYNIPKIRSLFIRKDTELTFCDLKNDKREKYDAVIFMSVQYWSKKTVNSITSIAKKNIVYPFGSDVLRCKPRYRKYAKFLMDKADVIATVGPSTIECLTTVFKVDVRKIRNWDIGAESIDHYDEYLEKNIDSKKRFGLEDYYVIACGYNGFAGQNHFKIIREICKIKDELPSNYVLLFLLAYGCDHDYISRIEQVCKDAGLKHIIFDQFFEGDDLISTRFASDIFIHAQPTDNCSNSIYEFLLAGTKMLNGGWIRYPHLETQEIPYFIFDSFDDLGSTLLSAISSNNPCTEKTKVLLRKAGREQAVDDWANYILNDTRFK